MLPFAAAFIILIVVPVSTFWFEFASPKVQP
jgi:hypothetical protein